MITSRSVSAQETDVATRKGGEIGIVRVTGGASTLLFFRQ